MPTPLNPKQQAVAWFGKPGSVRLSAVLVSQSARVNVLRLISSPVVTRKERDAVLDALFFWTADQIEAGAARMQLAITDRETAYTLQSA